MTETVTLNRRQAAKVRTAEKVLAAARAFFETRGYEQATIRRIATAAGMSTGAVFANYQDKAELYAAVYGHPPISPEVGRQAMRALQAFQMANALYDGAAMDRAFSFGRDVLELAKMPPVPTPTGKDPADAVQRFLEGGTLNIGFVQYVQGQDGERIDATPVGG